MPIISPDPDDEDDEVDESTEPSSAKRQKMEQNIMITYVRDPDQSWPVELVRIRRYIGPNEE
jgi:hypothetical protein